MAVVWGQFAPFKSVENSLITGDARFTDLENAGVSPSANVEAFKLVSGFVPVAL